MRRTLLVIFGFAVLYMVQAQIQSRGRQRIRPGAFAFQSYDHSTGFPGESSLPSLPGISSQLAAQLTSSSAGSTDIQEQPRRGNAVHDGIANLPLYKQSVPGVYVKGHAAETLNKYEPTIQVAHHHGPNYQIPRNVASSPPQQDFNGDFFSTFN